MTSTHLGVPDGGHVGLGGGGDLELALLDTLKVGAGGRVPQLAVGVKRLVCARVWVLFQVPV